MYTADRGPAAVGSAPFMPHVSEASGGEAVVSLVRRLPDGSHVVVWAHKCGLKAASVLGRWMWSKPDRWSMWGRVALRLGGDVAEPLILQRAGEDMAEAAEAERRTRDEARQRKRLARQITLYLYDPTKRRPSLGLERGSDDEPFFRMTFTEKWERDRVADWLRHQKARYAELEEFFAAHGSLELERLVLACMREAERSAKERGLSSPGRRPLRFWRGE